MVEINFQKNEKDILYHYCNSDFNLDHRYD
jgi:hypothetical protein